MRGVAFDPDARAEFLAAVEYYEECQTGLGRRFREAVETEVHSIDALPFRFRVLHTPFRRCLVPKFPYFIIFATIVPTALQDGVAPQKTHSLILATPAAR